MLPDTIARINRAKERTQFLPVVSLTWSCPGQPFGFRLAQVLEFTGKETVFVVGNDFTWETARVFSRVVCISNIFMGYLRAIPQTKFKTNQSVAR